MGKNDDARHRRRFRNACGPGIARARGERGLTQDALATRLQLSGLDLDRIALAKIEARIRSVFDWELVVIARALDTSADSLLPSLVDLSAILPSLRRGHLE